MHEEISLKQARRDLQYMKEHYGNVIDFCDTRRFNDILFGKSTIKDTIVDNIEAYYKEGVNSCSLNHKIPVYPDMTDKRVQRIAKRYGIL